MSKEPSEKSITEIHEEQAHVQASEERDEIDHADFVLDSNIFLYFVFVACVVVQAWNHPWVMHLLPLPVVYYGAKQLFLSSSAPAHFETRVRTPAAGFIARLNEIRPLGVTLDIFRSADHRLVSICEDCLDSASSALVLVLVGMATVLGTIFMATQVYAEGHHLVQVSMDLVNRTVSQYPEINALLPDGWQSMMSSEIGRASCRERV